MFDKNQTVVIALGGGEYVATNSDLYCVATPDIAAATRFRAYQDGNYVYFQVSGGHEDSSYLAPSNDGKLGIYKAGTQAGWTCSGSQLADQWGRVLDQPGSGVLMVREPNVGTPAAVSFPWPWVDRSGWMAGLAAYHGAQFESLPLFQIPLPGAHDAGTYGMPWQARTQNCTIAEQLKLGIRFFDLRPRVNDGDYYIAHTLGSDNRIAQWSAQTNGPVLGPCILLDIQNFLAANPGETVIVKCQSFSGHLTDKFNAEDHKHFRTLLNYYLPLIAPTAVTALTYAKAKGRAIVFYEDADDAAGEPGDPGWENFWPYRVPTDQAGLSDYFRLWDPFWEDEGAGIANEPGNDPTVPPTYLTQVWKDYHLAHLWAWQAMGSARFYVAQCQMQVASGNPDTMLVPGYFSKVERSAVFNNHLNADMLVGWLSGIPLNGQPSKLRPNVMLLDFVEFGDLTLKITDFFKAIPPGQLSARYPMISAFYDTGHFRLAFDAGYYIADNGSGWAVFETDVTKAMVFTMKAADYKTYYMRQGGGRDGWYLSASNEACVGLYKAGGREAWTFDGGLYSLFTNGSVGPAAMGAYLYANASGAVPTGRIGWY